MESSILLTLVMFLIIVFLAAGIAFFIFGRIFHKKGLWVSGLTFFGLAVLSIISMFAVFIA